MNKKEHVQVGAGEAIVGTTEEVVGSTAVPASNTVQVVGIEDQVPRSWDWWKGSL